MEDELEINMDNFEYILRLADRVTFSISGFTQSHSLFMHIANKVLQERSVPMQLHVVVLDSSKFDSKHVKQSFTKRITDISIEYRADVKQLDRQFL